jgi:ATP-dependent helicase YprA (DUF1998 family)
MSWGAKPRINGYFQQLYKDGFGNTAIVAREHSGQLKNPDRIAYEEQFRNGKIQLLCCSPTMELGIDISDLTAVHMRNVPPDPQQLRPAQRGVPVAVVSLRWSSPTARASPRTTSTTSMTGSAW